MPIKNETWTCDECGETYDNAEEAMACESRHLTAEDLVITRILEHGKLVSTKILPPKAIEVLIPKKNQLYRYVLTSG